MKRTFRVYWRVEYKKSFFNLRKTVIEVKSKEFLDYLIQVLEKRKEGDHYFCEVSRVEEIITCTTFEIFEV